MAGLRRITANSLCPTDNGKKLCLALACSIQTAPASFGGEGCVDRKALPAVYPVRLAVSDLGPIEARHQKVSTLVATMHEYDTTVTVVLLIFAPAVWERGNIWLEVSTKNDAHASRMLSDTDPHPYLCSYICTACRSCAHTYE